MIIFHILLFINLKIIFNNIFNVYMLSSYKSDTVLKFLLK